MRETATCFTIAANGEHGRFYLTEGNEPDRRGGTTYWCVLVCHTTFGTVGHTWNSMGGPASWFLGKIGRDYAIGKLWGAQSQIFCGEKAVADIRRLIIDDRRQGEVSRDEARDRYDVLRDGIDSESHLGMLVEREDWLYESLLYGGHQIGKVDNPQALGFWQNLWPAFIAELTTQVEPCHA
ncbi:MULTISPECIES: hypothetical protein [Xanthomonas]|uniref:Uncharacterized protein n=2 Tax=Xanthomonas citri TaxID=346 RepID=A0AB33CI00_XANCI|nr:MULTISPECIES: hypothetical protein [Xanthomonas]MBV6780913.1 hypothetical protein [Xanthomonas campestris pv. trichodesmae]ASK91834.1 hypothetical protein XcvCFBP7111P_10240 [Xanthomonas citri pv. vignicola]MBV6788437.1 hypothetical protein [Xanthomonas campestris pv. clerodendri]MBZ3919246.1 hypothetical protein [Xanthomonas campestris pv. trichodesmae]MBZ3922873.1 hypothetical protein [Xanthomonas citri pv. sesbaniae]